jgi:hypothetical protein
MTNWGDKQLKKQEDRRSNPRNRKRGAREKEEEFNGAALDMKFLVLYRHLGFSGVLTTAQHWYLSHSHNKTIVSKNVTDKSNFYKGVKCFLGSNQKFKNTVQMRVAQERKGVLCRSVDW